MILLIFYAALAPGAFLLVGAGRKVWTHRDRLARLQFEGAIIAGTGMVARLLFFDPFLGMDPLRENRFAFWFDRGEAGLFSLGLLVFALGFFLERRPRPGLERWPDLDARLATAALVVGCLAMAMLVNGIPDMGPLPWSPARAAFAWGMIPFSIFYCRRAFYRPDESRFAEQDILHLEE